MKITVTKRFTFEAAHYLENHDGLCGHVHGHSYKLEVSVSSPALVSNGPEQGMVVDLKRLKSAVQPIVDHYDHSMIVERSTTAYMRNGAQNTPVGYLLDDPRVRVIGCRPTVENLAIKMWEQIVPLLPAHVTLEKIKLIETETSWVEITK